MEFLAIPIARTARYQRCRGQRKIFAPREGSQRCVQCPGSCHTSYSTKYRDSIIVIGNPLTLSSCRELREVNICASPPETMDQDLLSSITSTNIEKIALDLGHSFYKFSPDHAYWRKLDHSLCHLVDRLGCEGRLEVTIQTVKLHDKLGYDYGKHLPMFHGKGRVRVVGGTGTLFYCSSGTGQS